MNKPSYGCWTRRSSGKRSTGLMPWRGRCTRRYAASMSKAASGDGFCTIFTAPMEVLETKNKNKRYKPILEGIPDWPVYQPSKNRKEFIEEVVQEALERINELRPTHWPLAEELETSVYRE